MPDMMTWQRIDVAGTCVSILHLSRSLEDFTKRQEKRMTRE